MPAGTMWTRMRLAPCHKGVAHWRGFTSSARPMTYCDQCSSRTPVQSAGQQALPAPPTPPCLRRVGHDDRLRLAAANSCRVVAAHVAAE